MREEEDPSECDRVKKEKIGGRRHKEKEREIYIYNLFYPEIESPGAIRCYTI